MDSLLTPGASFRLLLSLGDILSDVLRGCSLLHSLESPLWGALTLIPALLSLSGSLLYGAIRRQNSSFLRETLLIQGRLFGPFLCSGPALVLWSTSTLSGVHQNQLRELSPLSWVDISSFSLSLFTFSIGAALYDKETALGLRSLAYFGAHGSSLAFRLLCLGCLGALRPTYVFLLLPCAYILTLCIYRLQSKNWECLLYALTSLLSPSGHGRRQGMSLMSATTSSGVKMAMLKLEAIVIRQRLFSVLFHCLSLISLLLLIVAYETLSEEETSFLLIREVLYGSLLGLYALSLGASALYYRTLVSARNATRLWESITPADGPLGPSQRDVELAPVKRETPSQLHYHYHRECVGNTRCDGGDRDECVTCELMIPGNSFRSSMTGREYKLMTPVTCTTRNVIYLVTCNKCRKQYVGKTEQQFKQRHYGHRREIETKVSPLGKHFAEECGYTNWRFQIIDNCENASELTRREGYWQQELQTYTPVGLNSRREKL